jgi:hypothetical protein
MTYNEELKNAYIPSENLQLPGKHWFKHLTALKKFLEKNNWLQLTAEHKSYSWTSQQRKLFTSGTLHQSAINELNNIAFIWNIKMHNWDEKYSLLKAYLIENNGVEPILDRNNPDSPHSKLGLFIQAARSEFRKQTLNNYQIEKLKLLPGFRFAVETSTWMRRANDILLKLNQNKGASLNQLLNTNDYSWIIRNKRILLENTDQLKEEQIGILELMNLPRFDPPWEDSFAHANQLFIKEGRSITSKMNKEIHLWLLKQRRDFEKGALTQEQISLVEPLFDLRGMGKEKDRIKWLSHFEQYKLLSDNTGRNGAMPKQLYNWVQSNRQVFAKTARNRVGLELWKLEKLREINFSFSLKERNDKTWEENFRKLCDYLETNSSSGFASNRDFEVRQLYTWFRNEKQKYSNQKMSPQHILDFDSAGIEISADTILQSLKSFRLPIKFDQSEYIAKLLSLDYTDSKVQATRRMEHYLQRKILFFNRQNITCALCGDLFPQNFIVVAHIKKRNWCQDSERQNHHIVMPACSFGCDSLYEKGYIGVKDGRVVRIKTGTLGPKIEKYIQAMEGRSVPYFGKQNKEFFDSHYDKFFSNI